MDRTARFEAGHQRTHKFRLNQTSLVVACFVPRVGKEHQDAIQRIRRNHLVNDIHGIVRHQAQICQTRLFDEFQQIAHTGTMYFDAQVIMLRMIFGDFCRRPPHAETDLEKAWGLTAEPGIPVLEGGRVIDPPLWPTLGNGRALRIGQPPFTTHKATYTTQMRREIAEDLCAFFIHGVCSIAVSASGVVTFTSVALAGRAGLFLSFR